jgi:circadian clock protein KaiB
MNSPLFGGIQRPAAKGRLLLRLFVASTLPNSVAAIANLRRLCAEPGASHAKIEIVDVLLQPERALAERIVVTPTLRRVYPEPAVTVLGALSDLDRVRAALGLSP